MAELKIKADSGGGTVSFKGPATTTSNAAVQLTLPVDDGTANQYLKTDGSGALSWATVSSPVTALNNATANELVTVGSTTTELDAEANLTFDGTNLTLGTGNLILGTAGKGFDFCATSDGTTMSSELLDDYEEGSWTATCDNSVTLSTGWETLYYTRVGRLCHISGLIKVNSDNSNATFTLNNLPFAGNNGFGLSAPFTRISSWDVGSTCMYVSGYTETNKVYFQEVRDNASVGGLPSDSGGNMIINLTYYIN